MFLIPLLILAGGAIWFAAAKATNAPSSQPTAAAVQAQVQQQEAAAFIAQSRALGMSTAQIADAWNQGVSPQAYVASLQTVSQPDSTVATASGITNGVWSGWGRSG
jgi:hypothetical protein